MIRNGAISKIDSSSNPLFIEIGDRSIDQNIQIKKVGDVNNQALNIRGWEQIYDQLSMGVFEGEINELWLGETQLIWEKNNQSVHQKGNSWKNSRCFIFSIKQNEEAFFCNQLTSIETPMSFNWSEGLDFRTCKNQETIGVTIHEDILETYSEIFGIKSINQYLSDFKKFKSDTNRLNQLKTLLFQVFYSSQTNKCFLKSHLATQFQNAIHISILESLIPEPNISSKLRYHKIIVDKVRDLVISSKEEPLFISTICQTIGVSPRTLQQSFYEVMGISPKRYIMAVRLNQIRRILLEADPDTTQVRDIAFEWGFWHESNFSKYYKEMFGELPSATLKKYHNN